MTNEEAPADPAKGRRFRLLLWLGVVAVLVLTAGAMVVYEARTSRLQARFLSRLASEVQYRVEAGPSDAIRFPGAGPYDLRLGYHQLPLFLERLDSGAFRVTHQARVSPRFAEIVDRGLFPIYQEKARGGLTLLDRANRPFFEARVPGRVFESFADMPELVWRPLLFVESRDFLNPDLAQRNPAVEWDRMMAAVADLALRTLGSERNVPGASTMATQVEKFRHSPGGITRGARDKVRQMASASVRAYLGGAETLNTRRSIVLDYVNSVPLAAIPGYGEVSGLGDGLWTWYGVELAHVTDLLRRPLPAEGPVDSEVALAFRQVLSLFLAHRRPSFYLATAEGRASLAELTNRYLGILAGEGEISPSLAAASAKATASVRSRAPDLPIPDFATVKAASQVRTGLLGLLGVDALYTLDRLDLTVGTGLDAPLQDSVAALMRNAHDPAFVRANGLDAPRLLGQNDPARVIYSFTLLERTARGNVVRVRTDNFDAPFSLNESARLELGSTAKLRTLVTYTEIIAELHGELSGLTSDSLRARRPDPVSRDPLTAWAVDQLLARPGQTLDEMLQAAMERRYSANPAERFETGGGVQTFSNFDNVYDNRVMSVTEGFRNSVNLVSIRTMRDVVRYLMYRLPGSTAQVLSDPAEPARQDILERFAYREGGEFVRRFFARYSDRAEEAILDLVAEGRGLSPLRMAWVYRTVRPEATQEQLGLYLRSHLKADAVSDGAVSDLFRRTDPTPQTLSDLGYLASVHPLELWVARWLLEHPGSSLSETLEASADARLEVYRWLFRTHRRNAQDRRIRFMLEIEAFQELHARWRRQGYPFDNLVPSLGTAIGSSGDRPAALADLIGIIQGDGIRLPTYYVEELLFAQGTPYETRLAREERAGQRVLPVAVARVLRDALLDVVQQGTASRLRSGIQLPDGQFLVVGGKTGTGDNRYRVFGRGGAVVEERVVNRTSAFVFFIGDRYFGAVTAYVPGAEARPYRFTSALPVQLVRLLGPGLGQSLSEP